MGNDNINLVFEELKRIGQVASRSEFSSDGCAERYGGLPRAQTYNPPEG